VKPLKEVKANPDDPSWTFPYATRETIDELRQYFAAFATRLEGWKMKRHTSVIPPKERDPSIPWQSVPPQHRAKVQEWFENKLKECKAKGALTQGKINSLRMNAANFGRHILTRNRARNKAAYLKKKRLWLTWLEWDAQHQRKEIEIAKPFTPSKQLEI
jgi:hypothetical protein